jgi:hypothetical protein
MKALATITKVLAYTVLNLFFIGLISRLGENYGRVAVLLSLIFWVSLYYMKYKKMEQLAVANLSSTSQSALDSTIELEVSQNTQTPANPEIAFIAPTEDTQKKSNWVTAMGVINILLFFMSSKYFLVALLGSMAMAVGGNSLAYYFYLFVPIGFLAYLVITVIAVYRSFTKKSPILSVKDSRYFVFWPAITLVIIGLVFFSVTFLPLFV